MTGHEVDSLIAVVFEYGPDFSGPGNDIFRPDRATGEPSEGHRSNFLHPVFYYYKKLPTKQDMESVTGDPVLPRPDRLHHVVEDFLTNWDGPNSHVLPLRRFLENILDQDLRVFFADDCFKFAMKFQNVPTSCKNFFLNREGSFPTSDLLLHNNVILS